MKIDMEMTFSSPIFTTMMYDLNMQCVKKNCSVNFRPARNEDKSIIIQTMTIGIIVIKELVLIIVT